MVDQAAVSWLISALQLLQTSDERRSGGYAEVWADGTIDRFVTYGVFVQTRSE